MARIRVWLGDVACRDTEDTTGRDELYLVGFVSDGETTNPILTKPLSVNDNQRKNLTMDGKTLVFDGDIPTDRVIKIGLAAYEKDSKGDWEDYGGAVTELGKLAAGAMELSGNPYVMAAGVALPFVIAGVGQIMQLDKDDFLGSHAADIPTSALPNRREDRQYWSFSNKAVPWWSEWDYTVSYSVGKGPVPRDVGV